MAVKTQAQLLADIATYIADNTTGDISASDVRQRLIDIVDSAAFAGKKVYKALLTQTGTNAPVATVLENTLSGTPVWSYGTVGRYLLTLVGEFDASKTMIFISNNDIASLFSSYRLSDDVIRLECSDLSLVKADDLVNGLPITIEVYP